MTTTSTRPRRLALGATAAVLAFGAGFVGPAATPASAESLPSSYANLSKGSSTSRETTFILSGRFGAYNLQHAQLLMNKKPYVVMRGDDWGSDEQLTDLDWISWDTGTNNGAYFSKTFTIPTSALNEDSPGKDEVYAHISLNTGGNNWRSVKSNNINGSW